MIPSVSEFFNQDLEFTQEPTNTYKINLEDNRVQGYTDKLEAMRQAVFKILSTERYQYLMYSFNYGVELNDLYGQPVSYVCPELERRIAEALTWDERIDSVSDFSFDTSHRGEVRALFIVHTIYGEFEYEKVVNI